MKVLVHSLRREIKRQLTEECSRQNITLAENTLLNLLNDRLYMLGEELARGHLEVAPWDLIVTDAYNKELKGKQDVATRNLKVTIASE